MKPFFFLFFVEFFIWRLCKNQKNKEIPNIRGRIRKMISFWLGGEYESEKKKKQN
jgi:hypothetical protein